MNDSGASRPDYVYEYHWGRILLAIVVIAALLGILSYGWLARSSDVDPARPADLGSTATETAPLVGDSATTTAAAEPVTRDSGALTDNTASAARSESEPKSEAERESLTQPLVSQADTIAPNKDATRIAPTPAPTPTPASDSSVEASTASKTSQIMAKAIDPAPRKQVNTMNTTISATQPTKAAPDAIAKPSIAASNTRTKAELFTAAIKRAKLTTQVTRLEPGQELPADYKGNPDALSKVYFYTEVLGQAGKTHYHHWYHNGKLTAKVPIAIGSDRWRCYSSKYITDTQTGDWAVKVTDGKGRLLAQSEFHFSGED